MKTIKYKIIFSSLILLLIASACVQDDDFNIPTLEIEEPIFADTSSFVQIDAILGSLAQAQNSEGLDAKVTFEIENQYLEGYVVSSDKAGNFFEEIIIQDKAENPTAGVRVLINVSSLFTSYEFGRKLYIDLEGLSIGIQNGVATLGMLSGNQIGQIPSVFQEEFITRSAEVATIVPWQITFEDFSDTITNLYVKINNVQFASNQVLGRVPLSFAAESSDQFTGERILESCDTGARSIVSTSTFSNFKSLKLPSMKGSFEGILTKNFFGDTFNLVLNNPSGLSFDSEDRCVLGCGLATTVGPINLFSDDFNTQNSSMISGNGWTNYIEEGKEGWEPFFSATSNASLGISARVSACGSDDLITIAWLITPSIDLDAQDGETLRFQTSNSFADSSKLEVLFSLDWDGIEANITTAKWLILSDVGIVDDDEYFGNWIESGTIDLSCLTGTMHIAFRYTGNDINDEFNGTYELDEIRIDAE